MSTQVVSIDRGPNWGAGFQALAQGLMGIYQQQEQERLAQQQRQQQLGDLADQRAYEQRVWDQRHPMTALPSQYTPPAAGQQGPAAENPQFQPWMSAFPGGYQMPQDEYNRYAFDWATRKQDAPDGPVAWVVGANGQRVPVSKSLLPALETNRNVPYLTGGQYNGVPEIGITGAYHAPQSSGNVSDIAKGLVGKVVSQEEEKIRGNAYRVAVENEIARLVYEAQQMGSGISPDIAQLAENNVRSSIPPQFDTAIGGLKRVEIGGKAYWYDPTVQEYIPEKKDTSFWGDNSRPAMVDIKAGSESEAAQRGIAEGLGGTVTDDDIMKMVVPWVEKMAADPNELTAWAQKNNMNLKDVEEAIRRVQSLPAPPTSDDEANAKQF